MARRGRGPGWRRGRGWNFHWRRAPTSAPVLPPLRLLPPVPWPTNVPGTYRPLPAGAAVRVAARVDPERCVGCGRCVEVCPTGAISLGSDGKARVRAELCRACGLCAQECPQHALTLA